MTLSAIIIATSAVLPCVHLAANPGPHVCDLIAYYQHEGPIGQSYRSVKTSVFVGPAYLAAGANWPPIGFEWFVDGESVLLCGERTGSFDNPVFDDGFESGNASGWSRSQP